jgi:UPF0271 protein
MRTMDINCDCGESFGNWKMGADKEIIPLITTANVACGFHAGDPVTMLRSIEYACAASAVVGAHPGMPDLMGFGRRRMALTADEAHAYTLYQAGALSAALAAKGMRLHHVKPHGALYGMLNEERDLAEAVCRAILAVCPQPMLYWAGPAAGQALPEVARREGIRVVEEAYFDLDYDADGRLVLQRGVAAVDLDTLRKKIRDFLQTGEVVARTGERIRIDAESICVHGDGANSLDVVKTVRQIVEECGLRIAPVEG